MQLRTHPHRPGFIVLDAERSPHLDRIITASALDAHIVYDPGHRGYIMEACAWAALRESIMRPLGHSVTGVPTREEPRPPPLGCAVTPTTAPNPDPEPPPSKRSRCNAEIQTDPPSHTTRGTQTEEMPTALEPVPPPEPYGCPSAEDEEEGRSYTVESGGVNLAIGTGTEVSTERRQRPLESQVLSRPVIVLQQPPPAPVDTMDVESMLSGYEDFPDVVRRRLLLSEFLDKR